MNAASVNSFTLQFIRIVSMPIFTLGFIGNIFNILVFTRPRLIKNPCSTYFLCSSVVNLSVLVFGLLSRFLSDGFGIDPSSYNLGYCRFRYFILHTSMVLSSWFTVLAGVDRYCISSRNARRRQLSTLPNSRYASGVAIVICLVVYSHVLGLFTIQQLSAGPSCYAPTGAYRVFYDFFYFATYSFTPPILMIVIGLGTFYNVHQTRAQVTPTSVNNQLKRRDRQLIKMAMVQFICAVILTLPLAVQKLYSTFTQNVIKSSYQVAIENFIVQLTRVLAFIDCGISFYVFVLSGSGFRHEFGQLSVKTVGWLFGENSRVFRRVNGFVESSSTTQLRIANKTVMITHAH